MTSFQSVNLEILLRPFLENTPCHGDLLSVPLISSPTSLTWQDTSRGSINTVPLASTLEAWSQVVGDSEWPLTGHYCMQALPWALPGLILFNPHHDPAKGQCGPILWVTKLRLREVWPYQGHKELSARLGAEARSVWLQRSCSCPCTSGLQAQDMEG